MAVAKAELDDTLAIRAEEVDSGETTAEDGSQTTSDGAGHQDKKEHLSKEGSVSALKIAPSSLDPQEASHELRADLHSTDGPDASAPNDSLQEPHSTRDGTSGRSETESDSAEAGTSTVNPVDEVLASLPETSVAPPSSSVLTDAGTAPAPNLNAIIHKNPGVNGTANTTDLAETIHDEDEEDEEEDVDYEMRARELEEEIRALQDARSEDEVRNKANLARIRSVVKERMDAYEAELTNKQALLQSAMKGRADLEETLSVMRVELETALADAEALRRERDDLRKSFTKSQGLHSGLSQDLMRKEVEMRGLEEDLQRTQRQLSLLQEQHAHDLKAVEDVLLEERQRHEEVVHEVRIAQKEMQEAKVKSQQDQIAREESETALVNLQSVLEDFQANKESEDNHMLSELRSKLDFTSKEAFLYRSRAEAAESKLFSQIKELENARMQDSELKEKSLLVGKLRHEAVILNEHLTEALRRLKRAASGETVDRQLVTNVLTSFLLTPRGDTKRFEMLSLLSSILSWDDAQKELVGLQRGIVSTAGVVDRRAIGGGLPTPGLKPSSFSLSSPTKEVIETNESFSKLWVEFLLKESSSHGPTDTNLKSPTSPTPPLSSFKQGQRKPSDSMMSRNAGLNPQSPPAKS